MKADQLVKEKTLAALAKKYRQSANKTKRAVARELGISVPSVFNAEERPEMSLTKLRIRMIEADSPFEVIGPVFLLKKK